MVPLHVHTSGSQLDGACDIKRLVARAKELNMPALAITDHGNMIKAFEFQEECLKQGVKPILGCEFYTGEADSKDTFHLICLAKNNTGLKNLYELNAYAYTKNFYSKPRITVEQLTMHKDGLIITTACLGSTYGDSFRDGDYDCMRAMLDNCKDVFGEDFYIEIQANSIPEQREYNIKMLEFAEELRIKYIVTTDAHYVLREDYDSHDTMLCMQVQKKKSDENRFKFSCNDFYIKSYEEIHSDLIHIGLSPRQVMHASAGTHEIANKCDAKIEINQDFMPHVGTIQEETRNLAELCNLGFKEKYEQGAFNGLDIQKVIDRITYELKVIKQKGYCGYFLIVADYFRFAKEKGIPNGSRGSACGSEVAFIIGITELEPMSNGLLFERMLNPERNSPPDIDGDFCYLRRQEVIDYISEKYGKNNVAHIIAEGTLQPKAVCRKVLSAYSYETPVINRICKCIPEGIDNIEHALEIAPEFVFAMQGKDNELRDMKTLQGLMSHISMHAAGIAITNKPIASIVPCLSTSEDRSVLVTQWHKKILEAIGVFKFDILGLKTLTILNMASKLVLKNHNIDIPLKSINIYDPALYEFLNQGSLSGIFQFDAPAGKKTLEEIHPTSFNDVIAAEALCRPGVKEHELYINKRQMFLEQGAYDVPEYWDEVKDILSETYGAIVYQEQTMLLMNKLTGGRWTLGKADKMRKVKDLEEYREDFVNCCTANGYTDVFANSIYDRFDLGYTFNKSHAAAYAVRSMQCAYFSCYYPVEFMTAVMTLDVLGDGASLPQFMQECKKRNIKILPPDINKSENYFTCTKDYILYPLKGITQVGGAAVSHIMENRPYESLEVFLSKTKRKIITSRSVTNLIKAGAFDSLHGINRSAALNSYFQSIGKEANQLTWCRELLMQYELDTLGFNLTVHPLDGLSNKDLSSLSGEVRSCFIIKEVRTQKDRNGNTMAFVTGSNQYNTLTLIFFSYTYKKYSRILAPMAKIRIRGNKEGDSIKIEEAELI